MNWRDHITADPEICHGKPCFKGTRIMVSVALDCLAADMSVDDILAEYPSLTKPATERRGQTGKRNAGRKFDEWIEVS